MNVQNPLRLCFWSGPRNVSTALMYSFAQRSDTRAIDEPLYAHYLRVSGAEHPGKEMVFMPGRPYSFLYELPDLLNSKKPRLMDR
jgi:hypothetical protein